MNSKLTTLGVVGGLLAGLSLGTALAAVFSATPPASAQVATPPAALASAQDTSKALAKNQLTLARQALEELDSLQKSARMDILDSRVAVWERRQIEALQASGIAKGELVSALETYVKRMKAFSQIAEARREQARIQHVDVLDWQYRALEGEAWLNQAKSR